MEYIWIYITAGSREEAKKLAYELLHRRLVACVNILGAIESLYWWEDKIQEDKEVALVAKSTRDLFARVRDCVLEIHSYDCSCVVALPIVEGGFEFLTWIKETLSGD